MDTNLHSHLIALHIQERIDRATNERVAREARAATKTASPRRRRLWRVKSRTKVVTPA